MNPPNPSRPSPRSLRGIVASTLLLAAAVFLWFWTSGLYPRTLPRLGVSAGALGLSVSTIASDDGIHFRLRKEFGSRPEFRWADHNRPSYHHGLVVNLLGVIVAAQPYTYNGGDYIVSPNAAVAVPYWFLIALAGYGLLRSTGLLGVLAPYSRFRVPALVVMSLVGLVFLALNLVPYANPAAGRSYDPSVSSAEHLGQWLQFVFDPASLGDIEQHYGFPRTCYEVGYINGQKVALYQGAEMEFFPHRLGENLCLALAAMLAAGMIVQRLSQRVGHVHRT
jgi:hypothetical protein